MDMLRKNKIPLAYFMFNGTLILIPTASLLKIWKHQQKFYRFRISKQ
ncbi:hypothetical protein [Paenimyroides ceti]|nr:hypothetical protein [Paenimyroides ceti]